MFLENCVNVGLVITEMERVLRKGGLMEIYIDNPLYWTFALEKALNNKYYEKNVARGGEDKHYCNLSDWHITNHLKRVGINVKETRRLSI